jgi:hypothetical protein
VFYVDGASMKIHFHSPVQSSPCLMSLDG